MTDPILVSADALAPMTTREEALLEPAGLVIQNGKILAVAPLAELRTKFGNLPHQHFPGILIPGLVNAHTHLELSYQHGKFHYPGHFTKWVSTLIEHYPKPEQIPEIIPAAAHRGVKESLGGGVTCVGDISRHCAISRPALAQEIIRVVSFGEVVGIGNMEYAADDLLPIAADRSAESERLQVGISPHAPYTVSGSILKTIIDRAVAEKLPLAMHLGEHAEERDFLRDLSGPLGKEWDIMQRAKILDADVPLCPDGPIHWADRWGLLAASRQIPVILAHVNYCHDDELELLATSSVSVAYCPRTHRYFEHDKESPHRYRVMLSAGINVCLGTDSLASNPDLHLLKEAQLLYLRDQLEPYTALKLITENPAQALGLGHEIGTLAPQKSADFAVFPASDVETLIASAPTPTAVFIAGNRII